MQQHKTVWRQPGYLKKLTRESIRKNDKTIATPSQECVRDSGKEIVRKMDRARLIMKGVKERCAEVGINMDTEGRGGTVALCWTQMRKERHDDRGRKVGTEGEGGERRRKLNSGVGGG